MKDLQHGSPTKRGTVILVDILDRNRDSNKCWNDIKKQIVIHIYSWCSH